MSAPGGVPYAPPGDDCRCETSTGTQMSPIREENVALGVARPPGQGEAAGHQGASLAWPSDHATRLPFACLDTGRFWEEFRMDRHRISTENAPAALGPYSQAIVANGFVFCSGTVGIDPQTGVLPEGVAEQTEQALRNLDAILTAAGASLSTLVKTTIFYAHVEDFAAINAIYAHYMPDPPPARSAPANVVLPRGLLISIDAIAMLPPA